MAKNQKRSANTYQKIDTIFKRDKYNVIMPYAGFVDPVFEYLRNVKFDGEEKIDGENYRIEVTSELIQGRDGEYTGVRFSVAFKGKTDNANLCKTLVPFYEEHYPNEKVFNALGIKEFIPLEEFPEHKWYISKENPIPDVTKVPKMYTIYAEGYGVSIQSGGGYIKDHTELIGFDVKVNDTYLLRENRDEILNKLGMPIVPFIGQFTIDEAIEYVKKGFKSTISQDKNLIAEGLVLRTPLGLKNRRGDRIIVKVKYKDFAKYFSKYGTYDPVEQVENTNYKQ